MALALAFLTARVGALVYGSLPGRSSLTQDLVGKVRWFAEDALVNALNVFELSPTPRLAQATALLAVVGIVCLHFENGWKALGFLGLAVALVPLSISRTSSSRRAGRAIAPSERSRR